MTARLSELADLVGGVLSGDGDLEITGTEVLDCVREGQITFVDSAQRLDDLTRSLAAAVVVPRALTPVARPHIVVDSVRPAFARIVRHFRPHHQSVEPGISPLAYVSPTATIAEGVSIAPHAYIGHHVAIGAGTIVHAGVTLLDGCRIGSNTVLFPRSVLYENTVVGDRVIIHANAVLGAFGFGYESTSSGHQPSHQLGHVEVEDDVEIGAGTTIDRGTFGSTRIGQGTKIDNLVMIGHNCQIGRHNMLCAQVGIAGSCTTGAFVVLAGQVGLRDHVNLADGVMIGAQSGVGESVPEPGRYLGTPALPVRKALQVLFAQQRLPGLLKEFVQWRKALAHGSDPTEREAA